MLKKFVLLLSILLIQGCSGNRSFLTSSPSSSNAVLIGKIVLDPRIDNDFKATDKREDLIEHDIVIKTERTEDGEKEVEFETFTDTESGDFFAVEIDPANKATLNSIIFEAKFNSFWKRAIKGNVQHFSRVKNFPITLNQKLEPGKAYYMGTLIISLDETSFEETGDQVYNKEQFLFVVPKKYEVINEYQAAKKWFAENNDDETPVVQGKIKASKLPTNNNEYNRALVITY